MKFKKSYMNEKTEADVMACLKNTGVWPISANKYFVHVTAYHTPELKGGIIQANHVKLFSAPQISRRHSSPPLFLTAIAIKVQSCQN